MKILILLILTLIIVDLNAQSIQQNKRVIIISASNEMDATFASQVKILNAAKAGCDERDIEIKKVFSTNGNQELMKKHKLEKNQFNILLIGKDGQEKLRSAETVSAAQIFAIIDQMPMRKAEMQRKID